MRGPRESNDNATAITSRRRFFGRVPKSPVELKAGLATAASEVLLAEDVDLSPTEAEQDQGNQRCQGSGVAEGKIDERQLSHVGHQSLRRVVRPATGHEVDLGKSLRRPYDEQHCDEGNGRSERRDDDTAPYARL